MHTVFSVHRFLKKYKTPVVTQLKFAPDPSPADFFPLSKMKSEFNKMPLGISLGNTNKKWLEQLIQIS